MVQELSPILRCRYALIQGGHEHHVDAVNAVAAFLFNQCPTKKIILASEHVFFFQQTRSSPMVTTHESQMRSG